jgi:hypothetical protein
MMGAKSVLGGGLMSLYDGGSNSGGAAASAASGVALSAAASRAAAEDAAAKRMKPYLDAQRSRFALSDAEYLSGSRRTLGSL